MSIAKRFLRTKQVLILLTSALFMFGTIWFGSHQEIRPIVTQTHKFYKLRPVFQRPSKQFPDHDSKLRRLGLDSLFQKESPPLDQMDIQEFNNDRWEILLPSWANTARPALVTALFNEKRDYSKQLLLIESIRQYAPGNHLLIFDLRKKKERLHLSNDNSVELYCNITQVCSFHSATDTNQLDADYRDQEAGAYKPIFIMKALDLFPSVMWVESSHRILKNGLELVWNHTKKNSIATFELENGCSAASYIAGNMLKYFGLSNENLRFIHMIESNSFAFNLNPMSLDLLRLWLNCSLTRDCVSPTGADPRDCSGSCKDFQPTFTYIGCHKYETSALIASLTRLKCENYALPYGKFPLAAPDDFDKKDYNLSSISEAVLTERMRLKSELTPKVRLVNRVS